MQPAPGELIATNTPLKCARITSVEPGVGDLLAVDAQADLQRLCCRQSVTANGFGYAIVQLDSWLDALPRHQQGIEISVASGHAAAQRGCRLLVAISARNPPGAQSMAHACPLRLRDQQARAVHAQPIALRQFCVPFCVGAELKIQHVVVLAIGAQPVADDPIAPVDENDAALVQRVVLVAARLAVQQIEMCRVKAFQQACFRCGPLIL